MDGRTLIFLGLWLMVVVGHWLGKLSRVPLPIAEEELMVVWFFTGLGAFLVGIGILEIMR